MDAPRRPYLCTRGRSAVLESRGGSLGARKASLWDHNRGAASRRRPGCDAHRVSRGGRGAYRRRPSRRRCRGPRDRAEPPVRPAKLPRLARRCFGGAAGCSARPARPMRGLRACPKGRRGRSHPSRPVASRLHRRGACADTLGECMPRMGMRVDETGQDDAALSVDDSKVRPTWGCSLPDGHDTVAMDDDMPRLQDPALGVHGKQYGVLDGQPLGQSPLLWVRGRYPSHILYTKFAARTSGSHRDFPPDFASFGDIITFALAEPLESRYRRVSNSLIELYAILRSRASTEARKRDEARSSDDPGGPGPFGERAG